MLRKFSTSSFGGIGLKTGYPFVNVLIHTATPKENASFEIVLTISFSS